ncbi:Alpha/Beta hydrolase protein [Cyathus striatus]|nr:Alpha/Beta hydrolase protein [Cyathus striatus]
MISIRWALSFFILLSIAVVGGSPIAESDSLRFVVGSRVCETTSGLHQMSRYIDVGTNMTMTSPFILWLSGGPGCSSMIGLFQENGPCKVKADSKSTTLNPFSWNNISNIQHMIYIDQSIGTGFSFGTDTVNSSFSAATFVWQAFQVLFESPRFSKFQNREFIFATESYGGHYGPVFATYFDEQNAGIQAGTLKGKEIVVSALMINRYVSFPFVPLRWYDPLIQNRAFIDFATNALGYGPIQPDNVIEELKDFYFRPNGCRDKELACYAAGNSTETVVDGRDPNDLRQNSSALFPPEYYVDFLQDPTVMRKIGAQVTYEECPDAPDFLFFNTGDDARTLLPQLGALADHKLKILIWAGDADIKYICNWLGDHAAVLAMDWYGKKRLANTPFTNITIDGRPAVAAIQNVDNFLLRTGVYQAGHELLAFQPKTALEIFRQVINKQPLHSVPV